MGFFKPTLNSKHDHLSLIVLGAGAFALGLTICRLWMNRPDFKQHKAPSNSENSPHEDEHENDHEDYHELLRLYSVPLTPIHGRQYSLLDDFPLPPSSSTIDELAKPASLNGHSSHLLQQQQQQQQQEENQQQHPSSISQSTISSPTPPFTPPSHSPISSAEEEQQQSQQQQQQEQEQEEKQQTQQEKFNWTNFSQNENLLPTPPPPFSSSSSPKFSPSPSSPSSSSSSSPSPKRKQNPSSSSSPNFFSGTSAWPRELPRRMIVPPSPLPLPPLTTITTSNEQPFIFRGMASSLSSLPASASVSASQDGEGGEKKD